MQAKVEVLICYAQEDAAEMNELAIHLGALKRQGILEVWHDQKIRPGDEWMKAVELHLMTAHIIVPLLSQYFLNSDYCYSIQMTEAVERHRRKEAHILPVILRPVYYGKTPFAQIQPLPTGGIPVKSRHWRNRDEAFFNISEGIRTVAENLQSKGTSTGFSASS